MNVTPPVVEARVVCPKGGLSIARPKAHISPIGSDEDDSCDVPPKVTNEGRERKGPGQTGGRKRKIEEGHVPMNVVEHLRRNEALASLHNLRVREDLKKQEREQEQEEGVEETKDQDYPSPLLSSTNKKGGDKGNEGKQGKSQDEGQAKGHDQEEVYSYRDFARYPPPCANSASSSDAKEEGSGFPERLYFLLSQPEVSDTITWMPHGRSWVILKPKAFEREVLPKFYSAKCKYTSFIRQVNGWGFRRMTQGPDRSSYYHELFLRGLPHLIRLIPRPGDCKKLPCDPESEPNFYKISKVSLLPSIGAEAETLDTVDATATDAPQCQFRSGTAPPSGGPLMRLPVPSLETVTTQQPQAWAQSQAQYQAQAQAQVSSTELTQASQGVPSQVRAEAILTSLLQNQAQAQALLQLGGNMGARGLNEIAPMPQRRHSYQVTQSNLAASNARTENTQQLLFAALGEALNHDTSSSIASAGSSAVDTEGWGRFSLPQYIGRSSVRSDISPIPFSIGVPFPTGVGGGGASAGFNAALSLIAAAPLVSTEFQEATSSHIGNRVADLRTQLQRSMLEGRNSIASATPQQWQCPMPRASASAVMTTSASEEELILRAAAAIRGDSSRLEVESGPLVGHRRIQRTSASSIGTGHPTLLAAEGEAILHAAEAIGGGGGGQLANVALSPPPQAVVPSAAGLLPSVSARQDMGARPRGARRRVSFQDTWLSSNNWRGGSL